MSDPVRPDLDVLEASINYRGARDLPAQLGPADWRALVAYARALEAQVATVRQQERERCADLLAETSARWLEEGDEEMAEELKYLAGAMRALSDREEPNE